MLVLVFRGIVLLGVLSWYSTHVWKMIDTYFKDKFDKYLQHEYEKNPKMREHVIGGVASNENNRRSNVHHQQSSCKGLDNLGEEVCTLEEQSLKKSAGDRPTGSASWKGKDAVDDNWPSESEVESKGVAGKKARIETSSSTESLKNERPTSKKTAKSGITPIKSEDVAEKTSKMSNLGSDPSKTTIDDQVISDSPKQSTSKVTKKKSKLRKKTTVRTILDEPVEAKDKKKKRRVKTIFFTEKDFEDAKIRGGWQDYDFTEFDDEDEDGTREPPEGVLVSSLPFKPRADIGKLERVTEDEFCPLTLEDEANCDETRTWP